MKVRDGPLFFLWGGGGGIAIGKKMVCRKKIAEINSPSAMVDLILISGEQGITLATLPYG